MRVALDPRELEQHPLRIGLSMQADVNIKDDTGGQLGNAQNTVYQTNVFDKYGDEADAEIARIIAANAGPGGGQSVSMQKPADRSAKGAAKLM